MYVAGELFASPRVHSPGEIRGRGSAADRKEGTCATVARSAGVTLKCYWLPPAQLPATWRTDVTCSACAPPAPDIELPVAPVIEPVLEEPVVEEPVPPAVEPVDPVVEPVEPVEDPVDEPVLLAVEPVVEPVLPAPVIEPVDDDPLPVPYAPDAEPADASVPRISTREFT